MAPFTLLRFYTKAEERKTSVFVKVNTLIRTKAPKNEGFENDTEIGYPRLQQCEHTKTDIVRSVFVIRQINLKGQKWMIFPQFLYENGVMGTGSFHATKTSRNKNGSVQTGPKVDSSNFLFQKQ